MGLQLVGAGEAGGVVGRTSRRRTHRCRSRAATPGRCRPAPAPPRTSPGAAAAADPSRAPRAERSRTARRRTPRPGAGIRRVRVYDVPTRSGSGSYRASRSQPRSVGNSDMASRPSDTNSHSSSGELTSPGYRQPMATITTGSSSSDDRSGPPSACGCPTGSPSKSAARRYRATAAAVGWSKTSVAGRLRPVTAPSRSTSSTTPTDVMPRSANGLSASGRSPGAHRQTSAVSVSTVSRSARSWSSCERDSSRSRRAVWTVSAAWVGSTATDAAGAGTTSSCRAILPDAVRGTAAISRISVGTL